MDSERGLRVKEATIVFDPNTVYGGRAGVHQCLLVTALDKANYFWKSKAWKTSTIPDVSMLPRSEMMKVEKSGRSFVSDSKMTPVQEMKQYLAGMSVVEKSVNALTDPSDNSNVLIDLLGFDGQASSFALKELSAGNAWAAATICHSDCEAAFVTEGTSNRVFSAARGGQLKLAGFPNFKSVVSELQKKHSKKMASPEYSVCTPLQDGTLVVKQALIDLWTTKHPLFAGEDLIKAHNAKYNPRGVKRGGASDEQAAETNQPAAKRICLEKTMALSDESSIADKATLSCGSFRLVLDKDGDSVWIAPEKKGESDVTVAGPVELCGFGSGDFATGPESQMNLERVIFFWFPCT
ncbi:Uncharacterized protein SCF082_LOCUS41712 [Durusdinium trenchii]|uniref:Uncharacterized protein n=1 Tax=Durusdinium trenchii TaxID=1381693 RepID=A0ABP0QJC2_9DINO